MAFSLAAACRELVLFRDWDVRFALFSFPAVPDEARDAPEAFRAVPVDLTEEPGFLLTVFPVLFLFFFSAMFCLFSMTRCLSENPTVMIRLIP